MSGIGVDVTGLAVAVSSRDGIGEAVGQGGVCGLGRRRGAGGSAVLGASSRPLVRCVGRRAGAARSSGRLVVVVLVAAVAVGVGGCTSSGSESAGPLATVGGSAATTTDTSTSTSTSTSITPSGGRVGAEAAVLAAYTGMWGAMVSAGGTSDWRSPELARYARDAALQKITQSLYGDSQNGVVTQGAPRLSPQVTDLVPEGAPSEARVQDCGDDSGWVKYRADGMLADDVVGGRRRITAIVRLGADGWKVADFAIQAVGSC